MMDGDLVLRVQQHDPDTLEELHQERAGWHKEFEEDDGGGGGVLAVRVLIVVLLALWGATRSRS